MHLYSSRSAHLLIGACTKKRDNTVHVNFEDVASPFLLPVNVIQVDLVLALVVDACIIYITRQGDEAFSTQLTLKVLVATIDAQWEGMGDVGLARYEPALLPPCPTITVLSYSN